MWIVSGHQNILRWAILSTWTFTPLKELKVRDDVPCWRRLMLQHLSWTWTSSVNTCILYIYWIGSSVVTWKKSQLWTYLDKSRWKTFRQAFSGFRFLAKQIGHQHQPVRLGKLKMPGFLAFCDPHAVEKLQEMNFLQRKKGAAEKQPKNEHLAILPRGVYVFVTQKSFESHKNSWVNQIKTFPPKKVREFQFCWKNNHGCFHGFSPWAASAAMRFRPNKTHGPP